jgi:hypothetical protein
MVEDLFCELDVAFGATRAGIVAQNGFTKAGGFGQSDAAGNGGAEYLLSEELPEVRGHLAGQVGPVVIHGEENAGDFQGVIKGFADSVDSIHELGNSLEGKELALNGDEHRVGGYEGVERKEVERRRAINEDKGIGLTDSGYTFAQAVFAVGEIYKLNVGSDEVLVGRDDVEAFEVGGDYGVLRGNSTEEDIVHTRTAGVFGDPEAGGGVSLGVGVDYEDAEVIGG